MDGRWLVGGSTTVWWQNVRVYLVVCVFQGRNVRHIYERSRMTIDTLDVDNVAVVTT